MHLIYWLYLFVSLQVSFININADQQQYPHKQSSLYFVSDFDGTIAHYEKYDYQNQSEIIPLPASSGSGKVALVSSKILNLLAEISYRLENTGMICASGQRVSTMMQRSKYFPFFNYWISENGGRIHSNSLEEMSEWTEFVESDHISRQALETLVSEVERLQLPEIKIDRTGYFSMVRFKADEHDSLRVILSMIPSTLKYTFNLGYLDVQLPRSGKLQAVRWLINTLEKRKGSTSNTNLPFIYMGDDDNDIEIAGAAYLAFIAHPCSPAMKAFMEGLQQNLMGNEKVTPFLQEAPFPGIEGTEALLEMVMNEITNSPRPISEETEMTEASSKQLIPEKIETSILVWNPTFTEKAMYNLSRVYSYFKRPKWIIILILVSITIAL